MGTLPMAAGVAKMFSVVTLFMNLKAALLYILENLHTVCGICNENGNY